MASASRVIAPVHHADHQDPAAPGQDQARQEHGPQGRALHVGDLLLGLAKRHVQLQGAEELRRCPVTGAAFGAIPDLLDDRLNELPVLVAPGHGEIRLRQIPGQPVAVHDPSDQVPVGGLSDSPAVVEDDDPLDIRVPRHAFQDALHLGGVPFAHGDLDPAVDRVGQGPDFVLRRLNHVPCMQAEVPPGGQTDDDTDQEDEGGDEPGLQAVKERPG